MRLRSILLCLLFALALAMNAAAEPCNMDRPEAVAQTAAVKAMPCHEMASDSDTRDMPQMPDDKDGICCCPAVSTPTVFVGDDSLKSRFVAVSAKWAFALPQAITNPPLEYDPPPPRA